MEMEREPAPPVQAEGSGIETDVEMMGLGDKEKDEGVIPPGVEVIDVDALLEEETRPRPRPRPTPVPTPLSTIPLSLPNVGGIFHNLRPFCPTGFEGEPYSINEALAYR